MITATMELGKEEGDTEQHMIAELGNLQLNTSKPSALYCWGRGSLLGTVGLRITGTGTLDLVFFLVVGVLEGAGIPIVSCGDEFN